MPTFSDGKGGSRFHMNPQAGKTLFEGKGGGKEQKPTEAEGLADNGDSDVSLHNNGDGTYHTTSSAGEADHPDLGHALTHLGSTLEPGGKHAYVHSEDGVHHMNTVDESGSQEGPHDQQNIEELKQAFDQFLDEEAQEKSDYDDVPDNQTTGHSDVADLMF